MQYNNRVTKTDLTAIDYALDTDGVFMEHFGDRLSKTTPADVCKFFESFQKDNGIISSYAAEELREDTTVPYNIVEGKMVYQSKKSLQEKRTKDGPSSEISLSKFDPSIYPFIKKALYRYPTAHNELEALAKLVQDLDKDQDRDEKDLDDVEKDLADNDAITMNNKAVVMDILDRLEALEAAVENNPQNESYEYVREVGYNNLSKDVFKSYEDSISHVWKDEIDDGVSGSFMGYFKLQGTKYAVLKSKTDIHVYRETEKLYKIAGIIEGKETGENIYQTYFSNFSSSQRGVGYATYMFLMKKLGWIIQSGTDHSPGAIQLWKKIVGHPRVLAWASMENDEKRIPVHYDRENDEIEGPKDVYGGYGGGDSDSYRDKISKEYRDELSRLETLHNRGKISRAEYSDKRDSLNTLYRNEFSHDDASKKLSLFAMWADKTEIDEGGSIQEKRTKEGPSSEISLSKFDPSIYPFIKRALYRYPTAHNELEALAKLVQDLDQAQDKDEKDLDDVEKDLSDNDAITMNNKAVVQDILGRLDDLEKAIQTESKDYGYISEVGYNDVDANTFVDDEGYYGDGKVEKSEMKGYLADNAQKIRGSFKLRDDKYIVTTDGDDYVTVYHDLEYSYLPIGKIDIEHNGKNRRVTEYSRFHNAKHYRGVGYATYTFLMRNLGWVLQSGSSQSPGAVNLWKKLVKNPHVVAWATKGYEGRKVHPLHYDKDNDEVVGPYNTHGGSVYGTDTEQAKLDADQEAAEVDAETEWENGEITKKEMDAKIRKIRKQFGREQQADRQAERIVINIMWGKTTEVDEGNSARGSFKDKLDELKIEKSTDKNLGIPRAEMPQVESKDYPELFKWFKKHGVELKKHDAEPASLKPVQNEFSDPGIVQSIEKGVGNTMPVKPIIASSDDYIIDGHHRWLAALNTGQMIPTLQANVDVHELLDVVLKFPKTYFKDIYEGVGRITDYNETDDVGPNQTSIEAKKLGFDVDKDGYPPLHSGGKRRRKLTPKENSVAAYNLGLTETTDYAFLGESEKLVEYTVTNLQGQPVKVLANPSKAALKNMMEKSRSHGELRGLITDDGKFWFWDAFDMIHSQMAQALGYNYETTKELYLDKKGKGDAITLELEEGGWRNPRLYTLAVKGPYVKRVFTKWQKKNGDIVYLIDPPKNLPGKIVESDIKETSILKEGGTVIPKYWINPSQRKIVKVDNEQNPGWLHHTTDVHYNPEKYGVDFSEYLSGEPNKYYDIGIARAMYENGWVRFSSERGKDGQTGHFTGDSLKNIARAIPMARRVDDSFVVVNGEIEQEGSYKDSLYLTTDSQIKSFARSGKKPSEVAAFQESEDEEKIDLPDLEVGDEMMVGKFKNRKAEIKGFKKDKHNQPIAKTNKGDQQIFKGRIKKLMPEKLSERDETEIDSVEISEVVGAMENMVTRARRTNLKAADLYHDVIKKGTWVDWLQEHFVPIWEEYGYPLIGTRDWGKVEEQFRRKYILDEKYGMPEVNEAKKSKKANFKIQLERADGMYILHIQNSKTKERTEVRGKAGYEGDGYDPTDRLHQLLDKVGKSANISELMNGEVVSINPNHPDGPSSREEVTKAMDESEYSFFREEDMFGVKTLSVEEIAQKHKVPVKDIEAQLSKGTKIEREHTRNEKMADEIARDHLAEIPDYYDRLKKMEKGVTEAPIKLGGGKNKEKAKAFIDKVYAKYPHMFDGNNHVMTWGEGQDMQFAAFELEPTFKDGVVDLKWIMTHPKKAGVGRKAIEELQRMAAEDNITLTLYAWENGPVSQAQLMKIYKKLGFKPTASKSKSMIWKPRADDQVMTESARVEPNNKQVVDAILKVLPISQEIWFHGSRARGTHHRNSDTDILVVVPSDIVGDPYLEAVLALRKLSAQFRNYDIQPTHNRGHIYHFAREEGKLLWAKNDDMEARDR